MRKALTSATLLAVAALCGCAMTPERIQLDYSPAPGTAALPAAAGLPVLVRVADRRLDKSRVGTKRNAHDLPLAPIYADDVAGTLQRAVEAELQARGFAAPGPAGTVHVQLELDNFMSRFKMWTVSADVMADVSFAVSVPAAGGGYARRIAGQSVKTGLPLITAERAREALDLALRDAVSRLFADPAFTAALLAARQDAARASL